MMRMYNNKKALAPELNTVIPSHPEAALTCILDPTPLRGNLRISNLHNQHKPAPKSEALKAPKKINWIMYGLGEVGFPYYHPYPPLNN